MKQFYLAICLLLLVMSVFAQNTFSIKGKVYTESGVPLSHVTIKIAGTPYVAISDQDGQYVFPSLPKGKHTLLISSVEIKTNKINIDLTKNYTDLTIKVQGVDDNALEEVRVERKTVKKDIETSGFAVAVIETKEASLRNLTTNELLDRAVGVRVRQNGGEGAPIEYNLNGMSGSTIGIFLDGIEISTYGSSFNLNTIPPAMIERIEVYKGVLPSHLSGNYIGGAINVVMKKDASSNSINVAASYGSFNTYRADIGGLYRNSNNGFTTRISGFFSHSDNSYEMWGKFSKYNRPGGRLVRNYRVKRPNDKFETKGGRFEFGFTDVKWADQFFVGYTISNSYKEIPHGITMTSPYFGRFNEYDAHVFSINYNKRNLFVDGLSLNVNAVHSTRSTYLQDTVSRAYNWDHTPLILNAEGKPIYTPYKPGKGQQGDAVISDIQRKISNVRTNISYTIFSGQRVSFNHKYEATRREDKDLLQPERSKWATNNDLNTNIFALNYEAELFEGKLRTNFFGKYGVYQTIQNKPLREIDGEIQYDKQQSTRNNKGFGGTVSYQALKDGFIIASAEKSFIMPTERHIYGEPENNLLPNANILPELAVNYNLGGRYLLPTLDKHKFSFYGNFFWRNGYDKIFQQTRIEPVIEGREHQVEDIQTTQFVNLSKTQSIGFEAEVNYIYADKLNAMVNLSKFNSLNKAKFDDRGKPNSFYDFQVPNEPFFTINANVQYRLNNLIQKKSITNVYYNMGYVAPYSTIWYQSDWFTTPRQLSHDLGFSHRLPKGNIVISVDAKNIMNAEVYDNFGVQKPGRAFYVKLNYTINKFK